MKVAACPIWVASYGVIPHAYSVASGPAAATASSPEEVSNTRGSGPCPGSSGMLTPRQESMSAGYLCRSPWPAGWPAATACPEAGTVACSDGQLSACDACSNA